MNENTEHIDPRNEFRVVTDAAFVRIELEHGFYITINRQGVIIGSGERNCYLTPKGSIQIAALLVTGDKTFRPK